MRPRSRTSRAARGDDNRPRRARRIEPGDFTRFDLILAMDGETLAGLGRAAPDGATAALRLFQPDRGDIPDPYSGDASTFERCLDRVEEGARALVAALARRGGDDR